MLLLSSSLYTGQAIFECACKGVKTQDEVGQTRGDNLVLRHSVSVCCPPRIHLFAPKTLPGHTRHVCAPQTMDVSHNGVIWRINIDGRCDRMPVESPMLRRTKECRWPLRGQGRRLHRIKRPVWNCPVHRKNGCSAAGQRAYVSGVGRGSGRGVCIRLLGEKLGDSLQAGGLGERNKDSMFLSLGYVFV